MPFTLSPTYPARWWCVPPPPPHCISRLSLCCRLLSQSSFWPKHSLQLRHDALRRARTDPTLSPTWPAMASRRSNARFGPPPVAASPSLPPPHPPCPRATSSTASGKATVLTQLLLRRRRPPVSQRRCHPQTRACAGSATTTVIWRRASLKRTSGSSSAPAPAQVRSCTASDLDRLSL